MNAAVTTLIILAVMTVLFVIGTIPLGLVSMAGAILLACLGVITKADVFSAFSGSTIVLLGAMMMVGQALFHTGVADMLAEIMVKQKTELLSPL